MGRIADEAKQADERRPWTNKVDDVLAELDDADRAVVLGWLMGSTGVRAVSADLADYDIHLSESTIERWRLAQQRGRGVLWAA